MSGSLLATVLEGFVIALRPEVVVPDAGKLLMPPLKRGQSGGLSRILVKAGILLDAEIVVAPVVREQFDVLPGAAKFKQHLRVPHGVAVLQPEGHHRDGNQTMRAGSADVLDVERHPRRVVDVDVEAGSRIPGLQENECHRAHQATSATAALSVVWVCSVIAPRITAEVRWMTSRLSVNRAALPW